MNLKRLCLILWTLLALAAARTPAAGPAYPPGEADRQYAVLADDLNRRETFAPKAGHTLRPDALIQFTDRDPLDVVLRRSAALLADLKRQSPAPALSGLERDLGALAREALTVSITDTTRRRALFDRALVLRRAIAFANPLLDFNSMVFIKRHRALFNHMCDQYYGITQIPGGGVYILDNPFGPNPTVRDVLEKSVVESGRLKGQRLSGGPARSWNIQYDGKGSLTGEATAGGSFLAPDLSYDGKSLLFAYVECTGGRNHLEHLDPARGHWDAGRCYHLFKVNMDGSGLEQLTDGTFNDFDPCWMPSGRIAFISERRGGYLRCGRTCPSYTLYDMDAQGGDIRCLSHHETNEWQPSVRNDGSILWTRWDYVDRHGSIAHQAWTTTPDGRDPRPVHGNYSFRYERPDMQLDLRTIPGSHRLVATAAPHHGQSYGSLVMIDPRINDDNKMAPITRLTPDVDFPESQSGTQTYGEAWPLSEDYYLCAYDPTAKGKALAQTGTVKAAKGKKAEVVKKAAAGAEGDYGLYLVDSFGNKELIWRDEAIGCHNPMPLRARPAPPVMAEASTRIAEGQPAEATVGVVNVYNTASPFPAGTKIKSLRVYQIFPLSMPCDTAPQPTGMQIPQCSNSINSARAVLGTVPVEADGSAHFIAPAGLELYFQALDENGLAVTSMRSGTHFQAGERMMCQGCHEPRRGASPPARSGPLAMRRPPSRLAPDVDGSNPFSYPRLVQPVLDRNCVGCHAEEKTAPRLDAGLITMRLEDLAPVKVPKTWITRPATYYASYVSLTPRFGFYDYGGRDYNDPKWYVTTPGEFGARASQLYKMLAAGHHQLKLADEDLHRLTLWLDSCSLFFGVYEKAGADAQLRGEIARPTLE